MTWADVKTDDLVGHSIGRGRSGRRARRLPSLSLVGTAVENGLIGLGLMNLVALGIGGLSLAAAGRIWGSFWTHYANTAPNERWPVTAVVVGFWALLSIGAALFRRKGNCNDR
ncbi:MAG: hypothetical protein B7Y99_02595 [Caulobacterales bacterium 32-69-10]|nr:MAG: hypothetical protein B7Y99_02595 [Caulobacterales bacterium 32-69-10]